MKLSPVYIKLATKNTPEVRIQIDEKSSILYMKISGRCIPENPVEFFNPLIEKINNKLPGLQYNSFEIIIDLEYINSVSLKFFIKLFNELKKFTDKASTKRVIWIYDDDDTLEIGKDIEMLIDLPFVFEEKE